jgi:hypothetical protein
MNDKTPKITWDTILAHVPPARMGSQWDPLAPIKATCIFRITASDRKIIRSKKLDWCTIREEAVKAFDSLDFPYDSSDLAVGGLTGTFQQEVETSLKFCLPGPLVLSLPNRCCDAKTCALYRFYECLVYALVKFIF